MRSALAAAGLLAVASCADGPDRLRHLIPEGVETRETVFHRTRWFSGAVAVYRLDRDYRQALVADPPDAAPHPEGPAPAGRCGLA